MLRLYRVLLRLFPAHFEWEFGEEMAGIFCELYRGHHAEGVAARVRFSLREVSGLLAGAMREQFYQRDRNLSGGAMRSFRFPRWTIIMMILIFCAVNTAIEKGRLAVVELSGRHGTSHWWNLPGVFLTVFLFLGAVGLIGYCGLRVFRETRHGRGQ